jgi:predicted amidohydrolase YtcJ
MVVVQRPDGDLPLRTLLAHQVPLALASGRGAGPFAVLAWATSPARGAEALTMAEAVTAMTRGAAYAELADRDKGHLSVGALADLVVPSVDPFTATEAQLAGARSVLTLIGGRSVHDVP